MRPACCSGKEVEQTPDMVQRLADQLGVESHGLTLVGKKGQRVQFGCSQPHPPYAAPDNSSITFASKGDLVHHWLCCILLDVERDWTWDGLEDRSFVISAPQALQGRRRLTEIDTLEVGDIEIRKTAPFNALHDPDRSHTTLVFIDAVEPKNERMQPAPHATEPRFPDLIEVDYTITPAFKNSQGAPTDGDYELTLRLPITTPPAQIPRIVSAGIALSPYVSRDNYSETEPRRRLLWIEFAEPVRDPKDTYFARVLAGAPDQLISNNTPELLVTPEEPALPIDRRIHSRHHHRPVQRRCGTRRDAADGEVDRRRTRTPAASYLLPLPPGLHAESPEMFGFFTYEFRVGHYRYTDMTAHHAKGEAVWTTAQGRYGRPLRVPGIQHPAPTLTCMVNRDEEKLYVTAPYAVAVHAGRNVTADPPRTEIWALLYAQVKQADNKEFRNILLDDRVLAANLRVEHDPAILRSKEYTAAERHTLNRAVARTIADRFDSTIAEMVRLADETTVNEDATKFGTTIWSNADVARLLGQFGLLPTRR